MIDRDTQLMEILRIGRASSMQGEGISLQEALERKNYSELRKNFGPDDLIEILKRNQELVSDWIAYSEDKRTSGGWYLQKPSIIEQIGNPESRNSLDSLEEAVAYYVVQELDYCRLAFSQHQDSGLLDGPLEVMIADFLVGVPGPLAV